MIGNTNTQLGLAGQAAALDRRHPDPAAARPRLVDDASGARGRTGSRTTPGTPALGYDFLVLLVLRLLWRWTHAVPALPAELAALGAIVGAGRPFRPLSPDVRDDAGRLGAGRHDARRPLNKDAFGMPVPMIFISQDRAMHELLEDTHKILAYVLLALVVMHHRRRAAASFHQAHRRAAAHVVRDEAHLTNGLLESRHEKNSARCGVAARRSPARRARRTTSPTSTRARSCGSSSASASARATTSTRGCWRATCRNTFPAIRPSSCRTSPAPAG